MRLFVRGGGPSTGRFFLPWFFFTVGGKRTVSRFTFDSDPRWKFPFFVTSSSLVVKARVWLSLYRVFRYFYAVGCASAHTMAEGLILSFFFFEGIANVLYIYTYIKNHLDICPHYCAYSLLIFVYSFVWDTLAKWIHCTNSPTWSICIKNIGDFWFFNFSFIENNYVATQFCINNTYPHWRRVHIKHAAI